MLSLKTKTYILLLLLLLLLLENQQFCCSGKNPAESRRACHYSAFIQQHTSDRAVCKGGRDVSEAANGDWPVSVSSSPLCPWPWVCFVSLSKGRNGGDTEEPHARLPLQHPGLRLHVQSLVQHQSELPGGKQQQEQQQHSVHDGRRPVWYGSNFITSILRLLLRWRKKKENRYFPVSPFIKGRTQQHITLCVLVAMVRRSCTRTSLCITHVRVSPSLLAHIKKRKTSYSLYNVWFVFVCLWLLSRRWLGLAGPRLWVHQEGEGGHGRDQPAGPAPLGPQAAPAERPPPAALPADRRGGQQHGQGHRVGAQPRSLRPVGFIIAMHAYARWCVICCFPWRPLAAGGVGITPGWGCVLGESLLCSFVYNMQITIVHWHRAVKSGVLFLN